MIQETKKKCLQCNAEFIPHNIRGQEQKFCTKNCRAKYHNIKRSDAYNEAIEAINSTNETTTTYSINNDTNQTQGSYRSAPGERHSGVISYEYLGILQEANNAKVDSIRSQLRYEDIERRYNDLKKQYEELKFKYDILDNQEEEEEEEENNILGAIISNPEIQKAIPNLMTAITYQLSK